MTITIKLKTGNEAFSEPNKEAEIERIIRAWLEGGIAPGTERLRDYNGNTVGSVTITGR